MKICVLTTSYPRGPGDFAGAFVADAVEHLRTAGHEVRVVSPQDFRHFGIAYGDGIPNNLHAGMWRVFLLPLFFVSFALAARRAARDADVVHAHWLPSSFAGLATRKPLVVQPWGSDLELAHRLPWLFRPILRRARIVVCASRALGAGARALGARQVRVIPSPVDVPDQVVEPEQPAHVLFVGRLSEEKGIRELATASDGLPLVVVGDGPLRWLLPQAVGFVPHGDLGPYYERAAVVVVPSRHEGYGVVAREAMAYGRSVVATAVGGLTDAIEDGVTGLLVPPRDPVALRAALERILGDRELRRRLGLAARAWVTDALSSQRTAELTIAAYADAIAAAAGRRSAATEVP